MTDLIKVRQTIKRKKPVFVRQEAYKRKRLSKSGWRAPKGMHSKMRMKMGSKRKQPSVGYSSPKTIRGFTREGLKPILVKTLNDLNNIKEEIIILSRTIGKKKKIQILEKIKEKKLKISNIKNIEEYIKRIKENLEERKKQRKQNKTKKEEASKKAKEQKKEKKEEISEEEKEKKVKEEKRKILEQK